MAKVKTQRKEAWNRLALWTGSGKTPYVIAERNTDGVLGCSCWPWRKNRNCKHLEAVRLLVLNGTTDARCFILNQKALNECVRREAEENGTPEGALPGLEEYEAEMGGAS